MGWEKGKGLGKKEDGMQDCIQIKRREEGTGLGDINLTPAATFKWADAFWDDAYNAAAKNFAEIEIKPEGKLVRSDSSDNDSGSSISEFEIEMSISRLTVKKSEKSKSIKKEKKTKKEEKKSKKNKKEKKSKRAESDSD